MIEPKDDGLGVFRGWMNAAPFALLFWIVVGLGIFFSCCDRRHF